MKMVNVLHRLIGFSLGVLSALLFALGMLGIKKAKEIGSIEKSFFFTLLGFLLSTVYSIFKGESLLAPRNKYAWLLGIASIFTNYLLYLGLGALAFGDVNAIYYSAPIVVGILAFFILKEPYGIFDIVVTVVMVIGVMFVVQPTFLKELFGFRAKNPMIEHRNAANNISIKIGSRNFTDKHSVDESYSVTSKHWNHKQIHQNLSGPAYDSKSLVNESWATENGFKLPRIWACVVVVIATIASAFTYIFSRKARELSPATLNCQSNLVSCFAGIVFLTAAGQWRFPAVVVPWLCLSAGSLSITVGQFLFLVALQYETATIVSIARTVEIPFAYAIQVIFFKDIPNFLNIAGAILVIFAILLSSCRRYCNDSKATEEENKPILMDVEAKP